MKNILIKPLVTEKVTVLNEKGKYGFVVDKSANKIQIKQAVEKQYGVNVEEVKTLIAPGKKKTRYTKAGIMAGKTSSYKKAIVKVAEGEIIDFYGGL
ncbi:50S ribosomal protein L23 [Sporocytophaga myxococcoides]|uniref:Large ribosomal subunit protein uL23 n=1 Tax=Sporocytophaga myxococcoides TaxID=153721 RepID=A0A098LCC0_9BACT|nr:50S ribosomal protein L23 [Sporocytophaga myxococcoides]GAL84102.1 50S ribosomal protein L23 [Sporocytophaga myxococcoides]